MVIVMVVVIMVDSGSSDGIVVTGNGRCGGRWLVVVMEGVDSGRSRGIGVTGRC